MSDESKQAWIYILDCEGIVYFIFVRCFQADRQSSRHVYKNSQVSRQSFSTKPTAVHKFPGRQIVFPDRSTDTDFHAGIPFSQIVFQTDPHIQSSMHTFQSDRFPGTASFPSRSKCRQEFQQTNLSITSNFIFTYYMQHLSYIKNGCHENTKAVTGGSGGGHYM